PLTAAQSLESAAGHADDRERTVLAPNGAADGGRSCAELLAPESLAYDRVRCLRIAACRGQIRAEGDRDAEIAEEVAADSGGCRLARDAVHLDVANERDRGRDERLGHRQCICHERVLLAAERNPCARIAREVDPDAPARRRPTR